MTIIDPDHTYGLNILDNEDGSGLLIKKFVKREGPGYPGNVGHYPGSNLQENWRADIDRIKYLDNQIHDDRNDEVIAGLRACIFLLEERAALRHGRPFISWADIRSNEKYKQIELLPTCQICGHIFPETHKHEITD